MANRDLSNFREVTQIQPELEGQGLIMAGEIGSKIVDMSQQAKVAENLSAAQLDLAKMDNEFRIQNEANPFDKKAIETYKAQRKATLGNYRSDIGSLWAGGFDTQADNLLSNSDLQMQNWGYKQAEVNTLISLDTMGQNNKQLIMQHGLNYAKTGEGDLDTLLDFQASREQLMQFAKDSGAVGEVTAQKTLAAYDAEMAGAFLGAVTTENPYRARQLLDSGRFDSTINVKERIAVEKSITREIRARRADAVAYKASQMLINGQRNADPANKTDRKLINGIYTQSGILESFAQGDEEAARETVGLIYETGIVPEAAQSVLRGAMTSNDPQKQQFAYSVIGQIQEVKPTALTGAGGFSEKEVKDAAVYNSLVRAGSNPQFALTAIKESNNPLNADMRQMREGQLNEQLKDFDSSLILDKFDEEQSGWFNSSPNFADSAMQSDIEVDYRRVYKEAFMQYGTAEAAQGAAIAAVKTNAGISEVTGKKTVMKYAPEKYYSMPNLSPEENQKWLNRELKNDLSTFGLKDLDKTNLIPTINTKARVDAGLPPQYNVFVETEKDGFPYIDVLRDEQNKPVTIEFDKRKGLEMQQRKLEKAKEMEQVDRDIQIEGGYKQQINWMTKQPERTLKSGGDVTPFHRIRDFVKEKVAEGEIDRKYMTEDEKTEEEEYRKQLMLVL